MFPSPRKPWYRVLYVHVLIAMALGILVGSLWPTAGVEFKPLGDWFVKLILWLAAPIVFCTVVHGIGVLGDLRKFGRIGLKTILYFEFVSTLALAIGMLVANLVRPGAGANIDPATLDPKKVQDYIRLGEEHGSTGLLGQVLLHNLLLQVLLAALLVAIAVSCLGERRQPFLKVIERTTKLLFWVMSWVVWLAPIGVFGAMSFTVASYGLGSLGRLLALMGCFYLTAVLFVTGVLGTIGWLCGFSIFRFIAYIKEELLLVLGTSSSESALPSLIEKMERLGCNESTVGLVVPTGYSFNLDGTNIYISMAVVFLAQATNTPLTLGQQLTIMLIAMLTSKGSAAVTGGGFITLAATLAAVPSVPVQSIAIIFGIDRFMSECRALTNLIGNGVATVVISRWEGEITRAALAENLRSLPTKLELGYTSDATDS